VAGFDLGGSAKAPSYCCAAAQRRARRRRRRHRRRDLARALDLGVRQGYAPHEFLATESRARSARRASREGIDVFTRHLDAGPVLYEGKPLSAENIRLTPKTVQQPHPPLWIAPGPKAVDRAARLGCHFLGIGDTAVYDEALRRTAAIPRTTASRSSSGSCGALREQGWDEVQDHVHWMLTVYGKWLGEAGETQGPPSLFVPPPAAELRRTTETCCSSDRRHLGRGRARSRRVLRYGANDAPGARHALPGDRFRSCRGAR